MAACAVIPGNDAFASGLLGYLDCQAQAIGAGGYQALATPNSTVQTVLTGLLVLFVAFYGFRLLFGEEFGVRDVVLAALKVGIVIALAGSWPAYQTLVYDVVLKSPAELASTIGAPAGLPGSGGDLAERLDGADRAFAALAIAGVGSPTIDQLAATRTAPAPFIGFDTFALGGSRVIYLVGAIASFAVIRLVAGLLLALGPLFVAMLLFAGTRGLFEGWLRGLIGAALGALGTAIVLGVELALLEPWLYDLLARRAADQAIPGAPAQLLAVAMVFGIALVAILIVTARLAAGLRIPSSFGTFVPNASSDDRQPDHRSATSLRPDREERTRAAAIVDAITATQRRDMLATMGIQAVANGGASRPMARAMANRDAAAGPMGPADNARLIGWTSGRRTLRRRSASVDLRNRRT